MNGIKYENKVNMKISVCLSGNLLNWKSTFINCYDFSKNFENDTIDFFCHFWDNGHQNEILSRINCKNYKIDSSEKCKNREVEINEKIKYNFVERFDKCVLSNYASELYSMKVSSFLK